jgi:hypothetical protein
MKIFLLLMLISVIVGVAALAGRRQAQTPALTPPEPAPANT